MHSTTSSLHRCIYIALLAEGPILLLSWFIVHRNPITRLFE